MMTKVVSYWLNIIPDDVRINVFDRNVVQIIIKSKFFYFYCWRVDAYNLIIFYLLRPFCVKYFFCLSLKIQLKPSHRKLLIMLFRVFFTYVVMYIRWFGIPYFYYLCFSNCLQNIVIQNILGTPQKEQSLFLKEGWVQLWSYINYQH